MRAYAPKAGSHVAVALIGAMVLALFPILPGLVRLASDTFAILGYTPPKTRPIDRAPARMGDLPSPVCAPISSTKDQARIYPREHREAW